MPIVGILCCVDECQCPFEYCLDCSLNRKNKYCPYPYPVLKTMFERIRISPRTSVTTIFGCPRQFYLTSTMNYYIEIQKQFKAMFGQIVHSELERCKEEDSLVEHSMSMVLDYAPMGEDKQYRFTITGTCDEVSIRHKRIRDWKFTEKIPFGRYPWDKHTKQANVYRNMFMRGEFGSHPIDNLEICYIAPGEAKILKAKVFTETEVMASIYEVLPPFYWLFEQGIVPSAKVEKEERVLCAWCQVEKQCHEEYHNKASIKQIDTMLGGLI